MKEIQTDFNNKVKQSTKEERVKEIKSKYSRAYEKWTDEEKQKLELLNSSGKSLTAIAEELQRQHWGD